MSFRVVEGSIVQLGSVSGTDQTPIGINADYNRAQRIYIENPVAVLLTATGVASFIGAGEVVVSQAGGIITVSGTPQVDSLNALIDAVTIAGTGGNTILTQGQTITVSGFREEFVATSGNLQNQIDILTGGSVSSLNARTGHVLVSGTQNVTTQTVGQTITVTGPDLTPYATTAELVSVSGHLQTQIDGIDVDEVEPAIIGDNFISVISGSNTTQLVTKAIVAGSNVTVISGSNNVTISASAEPANAIVGDDGLISVTSGTNTTRVGAKALTGSDGITVTSGTNAVDFAGFRTEFVSASGSLQTQIDGKLSNVVEDLSPQLGGSLYVNNYTITAEQNQDVVVATSGSGGIVFLTEAAGGINFQTAGGFFNLDVDSGSIQIKGDALTLDGIVTSATNRRIQDVGAPVVGTDAARLQDIQDLKVHALVGDDFISVSSGTNTVQIVADAIVGVDGIAVISGTNIVTISGFREEFVAASGSLQSQINSLDDFYATDAELVVVSGHLQSQINSIDVDEIEPAIIGDDFISVISGGNTIQLVADAIIAGNNITVVSGTNGVTISSTASGDGKAIVGDSFISVNSGTDTIKLVADAIVGVDGNTVISGTDRVTVSGFLSTLQSTSMALPGSSHIGFPTASGFAAQIITTFPAPSVYNAESFFWSAGWAAGGDITDVTGSQIMVASGIGAVRFESNSLSPLLAFGWPQTSGISIPSESVRYVGVSYSGTANTATVVSKTSDEWNYYTEFPLGTAINRNNEIHIVHAPFIAGDAISLVNQRFDATFPLLRDNKVGGLILGETGTRNITLTAGKLWRRLNSFTIAALDTSASSTFYSYYRDGLGGFTRLTGQTQWPNTQYDDGTGTLATLSANRWAVLWFYVESEGHLSLLYGRGQYTGQASAEQEAAPATLPTGFSDEALLIGRLTFQNGAATAANIVSAFTATFQTAGVTDHGDLTGLADDDHLQYSRVDGTRAFTGVVGGITPTSAAHLATKGYVDSVVDEIEPAIVGAGLIFVSSGTNSTTIGAKALTGSDGITITSGTTTVDIAGFRTEFVNASGSLQTQINAVEATDVDSITASGTTLTGDVTFSGIGTVSLYVNGQTVTISGQNGDILEGAAAQHFPPFVVTFNAQTAAGSVFSNMPAGLQPAFNNYFAVQRVDLTNYSQVRLQMIKASTAGFTGARMFLGSAPTFSTTVSNYTSISNPDASVNIDVTNTFLETGWVDILPSKRGDNYLLVVGSGGNGVIDPQFGGIWAQFRP